MVLKIQEIHDQERKSLICNDILRTLPDWFGIEESIVDYVSQVKTMPFYSALIDEKAVGFVAIKDHNLYTSEVFVMGVLADYHRQSIGKKLICQCEDYCIKSGKEFLTVKTLDESHTSVSYINTRQFYLSVGFKPLEVFPTLWEKKSLPTSSKTHKHSNTINTLT